MRRILLLVVSRAWLPFLLGALVFIVYLPSLKSGFVYDARAEMLEEGFITSFANIKDVILLKVLKMNLILGSRPGQLLYLMLLAKLCGKAPLGYHLSSNLLHSANVMLLVALLFRLTAMEIKTTINYKLINIPVMIALATLLFALHPVSVESVSEVSYSSSLLVGSFTLLALLALTYFNSESNSNLILVGGVAVVSSLISVMCKESGLATSVLLVVYWYLFRRQEAKKPWGILLGAALILSVSFLIARFAFAPVDSPQIPFLGGSFSKVLLIEPRVWAFMLYKLFWPLGLSADYTLDTINNISFSFSLMILFIVIFLQALLSYKSKIGALGVAIYWLTLLPVSNFTPLFHFLADRFYYLPLIGCTIQLVGISLLLFKWRLGYYLMVLPCLGLVLPLLALTLNRQGVFANEFSLWNATLQVSPLSPIAHGGLGVAYDQIGQFDQAILEYTKALQLSPKFAEIHNNLGAVLVKKGLPKEATLEYWKALSVRPAYPECLDNLGMALFQLGKIDQAISEYKLALTIRPDYAEAHNNLGLAFMNNVLDIHDARIHAARSQFEEALKIAPDSAKLYSNLGLTFSKEKELNAAGIEYKKAISIDPSYAAAHNNLGSCLAEEGHFNDAILEYEKALKLDPNDTEAKSNLRTTTSQLRASHLINQLEQVAKYNTSDSSLYNSLGVAFVQKGDPKTAIAQFKKAVVIRPNFAEAYTNMGNVLYESGQTSEALEQFKRAVAIDPADAEAHTNIGNILFQTGKIDQALDQFQMAIKSNPNYAKAYNNLGVALIERGQMKGAISQFQRAIQLKPDYADAQSNLDKAMLTLQQESNVKLK